MSNNRTDVKVQLESSQTDFLHHLSDVQNSRILFSAPFGSGKSTFLKDFFLSYENLYININLYPVNYAVAGNEDVFELIKFDILCELLGKYAEKISTFQSETFTLALQAQVFALHSEKASSVIKSIISASSKIGKSALEVFEAIDKLNLEFNKFRDKMESLNEISIKDFLNIQSSKSGSIHEMDDTSFFISRCIEELSGPKEREVVLVIDDLDRLDPEHIFRLFNVFSAHYDSVTEKNKFGFDKVVFVCDIENIKKMYAHRYGKEVDFNGYMDKFYSVSPFNFNSKHYLVEKIDQFLEAKKWKMDSGLEHQLGYGSNFKGILRFVLLVLINANKLTLRTLDRSSVYIVSNDKTINPTSRPYGEFASYLFHFYILIDYLKTLFPNFEQMELTLEGISNQYGSDYIPKGMEHRFDMVSKNLVSVCLPFLLPIEEVFSDKKHDGDKMIKCPDQPNCYLHYHLYPSRGFQDYSAPVVVKVTSSSDPNSSVTNVNLCKLMVSTLKCLKERGIISN